MKQIEPVPVPQGAPRAPTALAKPSGGGPLHAAETVVAPATRKKVPAARADHLVSRVVVVQETGIGNAKTENPATLAIVPPEELPKSVPDTVAPREPERNARASAREAAHELKGAVPFDAKTAPKKEKAHVAGGDACADKQDSVGDATHDQQSAAISPVIPGIGDRAFQLALVAAPGIPSLRAPKLGKKPTISGARPKSRAECERRSGRGCVCDPTSEAGCRGFYCGRQDDGV